MKRIIKWIFAALLAMLACVIGVYVVMLLRVLNCDHEYLLQEVRQEADCYNESIEVYVCEKCNKDKIVYGEEVEHTNLVKLPAYRATCTVDGLTEGLKCRDCGEILVEQQTIQASHQEVVTKQAKSPTCTADGWTREVTCNVCLEIVSPSITIASPGHTETYEVVNAPTCTEPGLANKCTCSVCYEVLSDTEVIIPAKGHTDQTADDICEVCGALMGADVVEIGTLADLKNVAFDLGGKYRLMADISLDGTWIAIGTQESPFMGYFDGNGHSVSGLSFTSGKGGGLFLYNSGTIANLTVKTVTVSTTNTDLTFGAIVAHNSGTVKNCTLDGQNSLSATMNYSVSGTINNQYSRAYKVVCGGIVGVNQGTVEGCTAKGSFVCNYENTVTFNLKTSIFYGPVPSDSCRGDFNVYFGGVVGQNNGTVENCTAMQNNSNTVKVNVNLTSRNGCVYAHTAAYIGGLIGSNTATVKNCSVKPSIINSVVGPSNGDGKSYLAQATLTLDKQSAYYQIIGENKGTVSGLALQ